MSETLPTVSVVMAARDAAGSLPAALRSIDAQTYPRIVEVIVAAADAATAVAARDQGAIVAENETGTTPSGLNKAIEQSTGEVIVRCDAHAALPDGYVARAVETLLRTDADNVGGMQVPMGAGFWERAVAAAMASPVGAGDARYRIGGDEGPVETVYLGVFRRDVLDRLGGYDEAFLRNQDYELNHRIREAGGVVWFDPELRVEYRPRGSISALAGQYFRYGQAKRQFSGKHPGGLRPRQKAPPVLVVALAAALAVSPWWQWALAAPAAYLGGVVVAGLASLPRRGVSALGAPAALATMHLSWGAGYLVGRRRPPRRRRGAGDERPEGD